MSHIRRALVLLALAAAAVVALAVPAGAHVEVDPQEAPKGAHTTLTFKVENESSNGSIVKVEMQLPVDHPLQGVTAPPLEGWTATVTSGIVTWQGSTAAGEDATLTLAVGTLPGDVDQIIFPTVVTYSDGQVDSWIDQPQPGGAEPEHPAPVLTLTGEASAGSTTTSTATTSTTATTTATSLASGSSDRGDDSGNGGLIAALIVGAVIVIGGGTAVILRRRA